MRKWLVILLASALSLIVGIGVASGEVIQLGKIIITVDGGFSPTTLPKHAFAPISLSVRGDVTTVDGSLPPVVTKVVIDYDRNGRLTNRGLPQCNPSKLENTTTPAAMAACRSSLVGVGFASGTVAFPEQAPFGASSKVLAFNGTPRDGHPVLLLHAYAYVPAPTTFVVPVDITKINEGRYGTRSTLIAPVIAGGYGVVTHFDLTLNRRYSFHGRRMSYLSARCTDGRLQATGTVDFADDSSATGSVFRPCHTRR